MSKLCKNTSPGVPRSIFLHHPVTISITWKSSSHFPFEIHCSHTLPAPPNSPSFLLTAKDLGVNPDSHQMQISHFGPARLRSPHYHRRPVVLGIKGSSEAVRNRYCTVFAASNPPPKTASRRETSGPRTSTVRQRIKSNLESKTASECIQIYINYAKDEKFSPLLFHEIAIKLLNDVEGMRSLESRDIQLGLHALSLLTKRQRREQRRTKNVIIPFARCRDVALVLFRVFAEQNFPTASRFRTLYLAKTINCVGVIFELETSEGVLEEVRQTIRKMLDVMFDEDLHKQFRESGWSAPSLIIQGCGLIRMTGDTKIHWLMNNVVGPGIMRWVDCFIPSLTSFQIHRFIEGSIGLEHDDLKDCIKSYVYTNIALAKMDQWELSLAVQHTMIIDDILDHPTIRNNYEYNLFEHSRRLMAKDALRHPECVTIVLHGLGYLNMFESSYHMKLCKIVRDDIEIYTPNELIVILNGLAQLCHLMTPDMQKKSVRSLIQKSAKSVLDHLESGQNLPGKSVCNMCNALASFRYKDSFQLAKLIDAWLPRDIGQAQASWLATVVHSAARLCVRHKPLLDFTDRWILAKSREVRSIADVCKLLWSMCVLETLTLDVFRLLMNDSVRLWKRGENISNSMNHVFTQAHRYMVLSGKLDDKDGRSINPNVVTFLETAQLNCRRNLETTSSDFEKQLARTLKRLNIHFVQDEVLLDGCVVSDFLLPDSNTVIEADGPWHHTLNQIEGRTVPIGKTVFRNRLLNMAGYKVLAIQLSTWKQVNEKSRNTWLRKALSKL